MFPGIPGNRHGGSVRLLQDMVQLLHEFDDAGAEISRLPIRLPCGQGGAELRITNKRIEAVASGGAGSASSGVQQQQHTPRTVPGLHFVTRDTGIEHPEATLPRICTGQEFHQTNKQTDLGEVGFHAVNDAIQPRALIVGEAVFDINVAVERRGTVREMVHAGPRVVGTERTLVHGDRQHTVTPRAGDRSGRVRGWEGSRHSERTAATMLPGSVREKWILWRI